MAEKKKISDFGTSLVIQWLRFCAPTAGVQVPSLGRELRQGVPHSEAPHPSPQKMLGLWEWVVNLFPNIQNVNRVYSLWPVMPQRCTWNCEERAMCLSTQGPHKSCPEISRNQRWGLPGWMNIAHSFGEQCSYLKTSTVESHRKHLTYVDPTRGAWQKKKREFRVKLGVPASLFPEHVRWRTKEPFCLNRLWRVLLPWGPALPWGWASSWAECSVTYIFFLQDPWISQQLFLVFNKRTRDLCQSWGNTGFTERGYISL